MSDEDEQEENAQQAMSSTRQRFLKSLKDIASRLAEEDDGDDFVSELAMRFRKRSCKDTPDSKTT